MKQYYISVKNTFAVRKKRILNAKKDIRGTFFMFVER